MSLECPECGSPMELRPSKFKEGAVYYACTVSGCRGAHGAHPDGTPLGKPADQATKKMRIAAHEEFDKLWKGRSPSEPAPMLRSAAYGWMRRTLDMTKDEAHIGNFDSATCARLIKAVWAYLDPDDSSILPAEWR